MKTLFFDIETGALPDDALLAVMPTFSPDDVALGNLKDPVKIAAKIAEAEANQLPDFREKAALSAASGLVIAIGFKIVDTDPNGTLPIIHLLEGDGAEKSALVVFWDILNELVSQAGRVVGFNIKSFDLPFLIRRSWILGIAPPVAMLLADYRFWHKQTVFDLREMWLLGDTREKSSLNHVARALGIAGKTGDHGANFAALWRSKAGNDRQTAEEYLRQDVALNQALWERFLRGK